jgi:hypothetical protein
MGRHQRKSQGEARSTRRGPGDNNFASGVFEATDLGRGFSPGKAALRHTLFTRIRSEIAIMPRLLYLGSAAALQPLVE